MKKVLDAPDYFVEAIEKAYELFDEFNELAIDLFDKDLKDLSSEDMEKVREEHPELKRYDDAITGLKNYAFNRVIAENYDLFPNNHSIQYNEDEKAIYAEEMSEEESLENQMKEMLGL